MIWSKTWVDDWYQHNVIFLRIVQSWANKIIFFPFVIWNLGTLKCWKRFYDYSTICFSRMYVNVKAFKYVCGSLLISHWSRNYWTDSQTVMSVQCTILFPYIMTFSVNWDHTSCFLCWSILSQWRHVGRYFHIAFCALFCYQIKTCKKKICILLPLFLFHFKWRHARSREIQFTTELMQSNLRGFLTSFCKDFTLGKKHFTPAS